MNVLKIVNGGTVRSVLGTVARPFILNPWMMKDRFPIFMFHRVVECGTSDGLDEYLTVTRDAFEEAIVFLKRYFQIVDIMEAVEGIRSNRRPVCAVTFDDGWRDNYDAAFPILKKHSVPATIFLCASMVGTNHLFWFERTQSLVNDVVKVEDGFATIKSYCESLISSEVLRDIHGQKMLAWEINYRLKGLHPDRIDDWLDKAEAHFSIVAGEKRNLLDWEEIREMSKNNISFGSHGMSHNILTVLGKEEKSYEIAQSKKILSEKEINFVPVISFPNGNYNQEVLDISAKAGYRLLLTASIRKCGEGESAILSHRIGVTREICQNKGLLSYSFMKARLKGKLFRLRQPT